MSSYVSGLNKKNLKLKNITFMSPITQTKLNMTNLLSETQRVLKTNNENTSQLNNYFHRSSNNKNNNLMSDLYNSYSTNRQSNNFLLSPNSQRNKNIEKNYYFKKNNTPINSHILTYSQFSSSQNSSKKNIGFKIKIIQIRII